MSDAQLTPLQQWLIEVAAQAKQRPWMDRYRTCRVCESSNGPETRPGSHLNDCPFAALDAALEKEPT